MAVTFLQVDGQITGQVSGVKPLKWSYTTTVGLIDNVNLAAGSNAYTFATGAEAIVFIPPSTNTVGLTLKGVTGDTGIVMHATNPSIIAVSSSATAVVISAATTVNGCQVVVI